MNRPGFSGTRLVESGRRGGAFLTLSVHRLELGRRDVSDRCEDPAVVALVEPLESVANSMSPVPRHGPFGRTTSAGDRGVIGVADAADGSFDPRFR